MDPTKGQRYIKPVKHEVRRWDHAYNISEDYIHPAADKELGWHSASFVSFDSDDTLENWKNHMHEVSIRKCGLITQSMCRVKIEIVELPVYEGIPVISDLLMEFEEKVSEPQRLLATEEALKATPACWWVTHENTITGWV